MPRPIGILTHTKHNNNSRILLVMPVAFYQTQKHKADLMPKLKLFLLLRRIGILTHTMCMRFV